MFLPVSYVYRVISITKLQFVHGIKGKDVRTGQIYPSSHEQIQKIGDSFLFFKTDTELIINRPHDAGSALRNRWGSSVYVITNSNIGRLVQFEGHIFLGNTLTYDSDCIFPVTFVPRGKISTFYMHFISFPFVLHAHHFVSLQHNRWKSICEIISHLGCMLVTGMYISAVKDKYANTETWVRDFVYQ
jgi:hypothetical protein